MAAGYGSLSGSVIGSDISMFYKNTITLRLLFFVFMFEILNAVKIYPAVALRFGIDIGSR